MICPLYNFPDVAFWISDWNSLNFIASPIFPLILSFPWKKAFWAFSFPVIRSKRSWSESASTTSGWAVVQKHFFTQSAKDFTKYIKEPSSTIFSCEFQTNQKYLLFPSNSTFPFPFFTSTIQVTSLPSGPPLTYKILKHCRIFCTHHHNLIVIFRLQNMVQKLSIALRLNQALYIANFYSIVSL